MSEYQYVAFRAIDGPVSEENLDYMHRQSTRAEITAWSFENEYHFGDFRGNAKEMLCRGYDIHLHYANFGTRTLMIRLPCGLPDADAFTPYAIKGSLEFIKDKKGPGGILSIDPADEPGHRDELWDFGEWIDRLIPLRAEISDGDLRPFYIAHLAICEDSYHDPEEIKGAPVPAGLAEITHAQSALAEFYAVSQHLIAAAAQESQPLPSRTDSAAQHRNWLQEQTQKTKDSWLADLMADTKVSPIRAEILAKFRTDRKLPAWPVTAPSRTIAQLEEIAEELARDAQKKAAEKSAREREKRLAKMAANPDATLRETEELVSERSTRAYHRAGDLLVELRDALSGSARANLAEKQAEKLKAKHPTARGLTSELRRRGFVPKAAKSRA